MPLQFLLQWLTGLVSLALLLTGVGLVIEDWTDDVKQPFWLYTGYALLAVALFGRLPLRLMFADDQSTDDLPAGEPRGLASAAGGALSAERWGLDDGPTLVLTHGWMMDRSLWSATVRALAGRYRIVAWDLPGLGRSGRRDDRRYDPDVFAEDLDRILTIAPGPAILVGHSIGGMTSLSWCRANPDRLGRDVIGVVLVDSTPVSPLETVFAGTFLKAIRKPLLEPLLRLTAALPPLARAQAWASYLNGSLYLVHRITGFGAFPTRRNLDHVARLSVRNPPEVGARGVLGVLRWDAAGVPARLHAPVRAVVGEHDLITRPDGSRFVAETAPEAELCVMDGCGHMGLLERPEDYAREIGAFADRVFADHARRGPAPTGDAGPAQSDGQAFSAEAQR